MTAHPKLLREGEFHIAVDLDDVMLDFMGGIHRAVETEYGIKVPDFDRWEIKDVLDPILGRSWWKWMRERDWLWPNFPAIPGAIGGVDQLRRAGHYVECVTSKPDWAEASVWKWLGKWRPAFQRVTIVDTNNGPRKVEVTDATIIVDDKAQNCHEFVSAGRRGILFDRTHNQGPQPLLTRCVGWQDVVNVVARMSAVEQEVDSVIRAGD